jgi:CDP-6-deoxy-D-xylo-4-hexulose-3-dehydrase
MNIRVKVGEFRIEPHIRRAVERVLESGRISEGGETRDFETAFASYVGMKHAVAVNSGTSALIAGLIAMKSKRSAARTPMAVMTSPLTYIATVNSIVIAGMEPVFADVDPDTFCISVDAIEERLESKDASNVDMLLPVHLMGYVCDMTRINGIAKKHGLKVFEDSSQAHGSTYNGRRAGSMSDASSFSFYIAHNIQAGELGAFLTNDIVVARRVRKIKANGRLCDCVRCTRSEGKCPKFNMKKGSLDPRFLHDEIGFNFKTMEFPAAIARAQIEIADQIAEKRRRNVRMLNDLLEKHSDVLRLPAYSNDVSYLGYPLVIKDGRRINRERLQVQLEANGVETRPLFGCIPIHQPAYAHLKKQYRGKLKNAEFLGRNGMYIGCHQYLTEEDLRFVADAFDKSMHELGV